MIEEMGKVVVVGLQCGGDETRKEMKLTGVLGRRVWAAGMNDDKIGFSISHLLITTQS